MQRPSLNRLPYVQTVDEILCSKFWKYKGRENWKIRDPIRRSKKKASVVINSHLQGLSTATRRTAKAFPHVSLLHPFEQRLVDLTIGANEYREQLEQLQAVYASLHNLGRSYEQEIFKACTTKEVEDLTERCKENLRDQITAEKDKIHSTVEMAQTLSHLPTIHLDKPLLALVGAPNVGKSSLVHALSTGKPEIANYPFTTRGVSIGHIFQDETTFQIADTPGLLNRSQDKRNRIEQFAIATLQHTRSAIGFVTDLSLHCGTSIQDQLAIRDSVRSLIHGPRVWIDIVSKIDLTKPEAIQDFANHVEDPFLTSTSTEEGMDVINTKIRTLLDQMNE